MAFATPQAYRSRYGHHVLIASGFSTLYLVVTWALQSSATVRNLLPWLGFLIPLALGLSLLAFLFIGVYGLLSFALGLSFYLQRRTLSRPQLMMALIMALAAGALPVAYCAQTGNWPIAIVPFLLLQAYLATASVLESKLTLSLQT